MKLKPLRKCFRIGLIVIVMVMLCVGLANALTTAWDSYTDPNANIFRIYSSLNESGPWAVLIDDIPLSHVAAEIPDHTTDNERVYYIIRAYDSVDDLESENSDIVSFYWTTGGGGYEGPSSVMGIRLLDCDPYDAIPDDGSPEWQICDGRYGKP